MAMSSEARKLSQIRVVLEALVRDLDHEMEAKIEKWTSEGTPGDLAGERWRESRSGRWHEKLEHLIERLND